MLTISIIDLLYIAALLATGLAIFGWQKERAQKSLFLILSMSMVLCLFIWHANPFGWPLGNLPESTSDVTKSQSSLSFIVATTLVFALYLLLFSHFEYRRWVVTRDILASILAGLSLISLLGQSNNEHFILTKYFSLPLSMAVYYLLFAISIYIGNSVKHYKNRLRYHHALSLAIFCFSLCFSLFKAVEAQIHRERVNNLELAHKHITEKFELHWTGVWNALVRLRDRIKINSGENGFEEHIEDARNYIVQFDSLEEILLVDSEFKPVWHQGRTNKLDAERLKEHLGRFITLISMQDSEVVFHSDDIPTLKQEEFLIVHGLRQTNRSHLYVITLLSLEKLWRPLIDQLDEQGVVINLRLSSGNYIVRQFDDGREATTWRRVLAKTEIWESQLAYRTDVSLKSISPVGKLVLGIGFLLSSMLGSLVYFLTRRQASYLRREAKKRLRIHNELEAERNRARLSASVSKLGVWDWNVLSGDLVWDEQMHEIYETPDDIKSNLSYDFWRVSVHPEDVEQAEKTLAEAVEKKQEWEYEFRIVTPNKRLKYIKANASPVIDDDGKVIKVIGGNMDVTHERDLELGLRKAKEEAESASRAKSEFLANMSHEIRTPMNGVIGMTELLRGTELSHRQSEYLEMISASANSLLTLLNDILDISKIESGGLQLENISFNLGEKVGDVLKSFAPSAHEKGIGLDYYVDKNLPKCISSDSVRIGQILFNLVGNAVKFTERGGVTVEVTPFGIIPREEGTPFDLRIVVTDTGLGINDEQQKKIFEPFKQADNSTTRKFGGTGLGLTIVRQLVEIFGGTLSLKSEEGIGSQFEVRLPVKVGVEDEVPDTVSALNVNSYLLKGLRCLIVDDNEINRRWLIDMTQSWGCHSEVAKSASEAIKLLEGVKSGKAEFEVMLLDNHMPGMSGLQMLEELKSKNIKLPKTIIMLSSSNVEDDEKAIELLGIDHFIMKPVKQSEVFNSIIMLIDQHGALTHSNVKGDASVSYSKSLNILLAEDNLVNQRVVHDLLTKRGHKVTVVEDGKEALYEAKSLSYDVILMDVQMPYMDGLEATRKIRELEEGTSERNFIIGLTANALTGDREMCLNAGMDEYLSKPVNADQLINMVEKVGEHRRDEKRPETAERQVASEPVIKASNGTGYFVQRIHQESIFDLEQGLQATGGSRDLLNDMIELTLSLLPESKEKITSAAKGKDWAGLKAHLHRTKGMISSTSSPLAIEVFEFLEHAASHNDDSQIEEKIELATAVIERLSKEMNEYRSMGNEP